MANPLTELLVVGWNEKDYADQRYYNANAGRFYTPDPAGLAAVVDEPQGRWRVVN